MCNLISIYMQKCRAFVYEMACSHGTKMPQYLHANYKSETIWKMIWDIRRITQERAAVWMWLKDHNLLEAYPVWMGWKIRFDIPSYTVMINMNLQLARMAL